MAPVEFVPLAPFTSFGVESTARYFSSFKDSLELEELLDWGQQQPLLVLGGGSNLLLTRDFDGLVLKNEISGITELHEDNEYVYVKAGAGENWHRFVLYCIERNWAGLENRVVSGHHPCRISGLTELKWKTCSGTLRPGI